MIEKFAIIFLFLSIGFLSLKLSSQSTNFVCNVPVWTWLTYSSEKANTLDSFICFHEANEILPLFFSSKRVSFEVRKKSYPLCLCLRFSASLILKIRVRIWNLCCDNWCCSGEEPLVTSCCLFIRNSHGYKKLGLYILSSLLKIAPQPTLNSLSIFFI